MLQIMVIWSVYGNDLFQEIMPRIKYVRQDFVHFSVSRKEYKKK